MSLPHHAPPQWLDLILTPSSPMSYLPTDLPHSSSPAAAVRSRTQGVDTVEEHGNSGAGVKERLRDSS
ncbi:hypothetical protein E2562_030209 [Oryza meyeriana var. granulata]|uniref:Uncharacterized protein n=1 Tax=Oryza meyeriana var. granulata TaxID=110450 RepID=A0A6G1D955_9ORYZ|nr:hypothetical protein E2562_030209 [Oryza meyeriana var. granulata]